MAEISAKMVQELRNATGAGIMDCKNALKESGGDMEAAVRILREKGIAAAAKRADKTAAEGIIKLRTSEKKSMITEINSETDFASKSDAFIQFADKAADFIFQNEPADIDALKNLQFEGKPFGEYLTEFSATIGEKIAVRRFGIVKTGENEILGDYIYGTGSIGVILKLKISDMSKKDSEPVKELVKDICMQITAFEPKYIRPEDVTQEDIENEKAIYRTQMQNEGKPAQIIDKIIEGKILKYYEQVCLVEQQFVKDMEKKIKQVISECEKKEDVKIEPVSFVRYKVGEGIEVVKQDFAEEVRKQIEDTKK